MAKSDGALDRIRKQLRSVLISEKHGVAVDRVERDYLELVSWVHINLDLILLITLVHQVGEPLLSPGLGFPSLESLLRSLPDVCTLRYSAGQLMVMGVASSATAHVQDMVAKQNTSRRGMKKGAK